MLEPEGLRLDPWIAVRCDQARSHSFQARVTGLFSHASSDLLLWVMMVLSVGNRSKRVRAHHIHLTGTQQYPAAESSHI